MANPIQNDPAEPVNGSSPGIKISKEETPVRVKPLSIAFVLGLVITLYKSQLILNIVKTYLAQSFLESMVYQHESYQKT